MTGPIDPNFRNIFQERLEDKGPLTPPQKPFDIKATEKSNRPKKDLKKEKKRDKNGKEIDDDEDDDNKPLPRPMGL